LKVKTVGEAHCNFYKILGDYKRMYKQCLSQKLDQKERKKKKHKLANKKSAIQRARLATVTIL
jgi:hypothetical protein